MLMVLAVISAGIGLGLRGGTLFVAPADRIAACGDSQAGQSLADGCATDPAASPRATPYQHATPRSSTMTVLQSAGTIGNTRRATATAWCEPSQRVVSGGYWLDPGSRTGDTGTPEPVPAAVTASRPRSAFGADGQLVRQGWEASVAGAAGTIFTVYALCLVE